MAPVVVWESRERRAAHLEKGMEFMSKGAHHRSYDNKGGKEQHVTEIVAQKVRFLGGGNGKGKGEQLPKSIQTGTTSPSEGDPFHRLISDPISLKT
jgi:single-stranded DNA-binding protein